MKKIELSLSNVFRSFLKCFLAIVCGAVILFIVASVASNIFLRHIFSDAGVDVNEPVIARTDFNYSSQPDCLRAKQLEVEIAFKAAPAIGISNIEKERRRTPRGTEVIRVHYVENSTPFVAIFACNENGSGFMITQGNRHTQ